MNDILLAPEWYGVNEGLGRLEKWMLEYFEKVGMSGTSESDKKKVCELFGQLKELHAATTRYI
jgi:hypothetical protein